MVLEDLLSAQRAERHPITIFFFALVATTVSIFISYFFFPTMASMVMVFLVVISMIPLFHNLIEIESVEDMYKGKKPNFFVRHADIIISYMSFFFGASVSIAILSAALPEPIAGTVFSVQTEELEILKTNLSGNFFVEGSFAHILFNNMKILGIGFALAFVYGTGGLIILSWNASILGVLVGNLIKSIGPSGFHVGFLTFLPHGIFEIAGFFTAGIAAGILSESIVHWKRDTFKPVLLDGLALFAFAVILVVTAAAVEVALM